MLVIHLENRRRKKTSWNTTYMAPLNALCFSNYLWWFWAEEHPLLIPRFLWERLWDRLNWLENATFHPAVIKINAWPAVAVWWGRDVMTGATPVLKKSINHSLPAFSFFLLVLLCLDESQTSGVTQVLFLDRDLTATRTQERTLGLWFTSWSEINPPPQHSAAPLSL